MPSCGVCLSLSVSVTFVFGVAVSKHILKLFTIWQAIVPVVFLHQTLWQFWRGPLAILGVLKAYVYEINCDFRPISRFLSEMIQDRAFYVNVNLYSASSQKKAPLMERPMERQYELVDLCRYAIYRMVSFPWPWVMARNSARLHCDSWAPCRAMSQYFGRRLLLCTVFKTELPPRCAWLTQLLLHSDATFLNLNFANVRSPY